MSLRPFLKVSLAVLIVISGVLFSKAQVAEASNSIYMVTNKSGWTSCASSFTVTYQFYDTAGNPTSSLVPGGSLTAHFSRGEVISFARDADWTCAQLFLGNEYHSVSFSGPQNPGISGDQSISIPYSPTDGNGNYTLYVDARVSYKDAFNRGTDTVVASASAPIDLAERGQVIYGGFDTNQDSHSTCESWFNVPVETYPNSNRSGGFVGLSFIRAEVYNFYQNNQGTHLPCSRLQTDQLGSYNWISFDNTSWTSLQQPRFMMTLPATPNYDGINYIMYLRGDTGYVDTSGSINSFHRVTGTNTLIFALPQPATITVNDPSCPGGTHFLTPGGSTSQTTQVYPAFGAETYTLNYTAPAGYTVSSVSPDWSQTVFNSGSYSFDVTCEFAPDVQPPTVTVDATPSTLSCPANSTISWTSTDADSCTSDWDNASVPVNDNVSVAVGPSGGTYGITCSNGAGDGHGEATVSVTTNTCTPSSVTVNVINQTTGAPMTGGTWVTSPDGHSGTNSTSFGVLPVNAGTSYSIVANPLAGYTGPTITNSINGPGSSFYLIPGQSGTFNVYYTPIPPFLYNLSNGGNAHATIGLDSFAQTSVTKTLTSGSTQSVTLSVSGAPVGSNPIFDGNGDCSPTCSTNLTFSVNTGMTPGTYPITVTGSPNNKTTTFNLVLDPAPNLIVSCAVTSPTPAKIGTPVTWTANVSGSSGPYTYVWSGSDIPSPAPTTNPYTITYTTVGQKSAVAVVTDTITRQSGTCAAGTVQVNFDPTFKEF